MISISLVETIFYQNVSYILIFIEGGGRGAINAGKDAEMISIAAN